jgi:hypothetical protein
MGTNRQIDFSNDALKRQQIADRIAKLVHLLAETAVLPAGRVIAVDSPWGSGKTWLAERLPSHLDQDKNIGKCIYVDAFQFDFHSDPFAVIASAILDACDESAAEVKEFRKAAGAVLKASLPVIGKALVKVGTNALGIDVDVIAEGISNAAGDAAEKTVKGLLSSFEETTTSARAFKEHLGKLASHYAGPLVIIIDELDRCRPDFALALLERVKHLFDVPQVAFVLFIHTPALHSAIRHTYGGGIDPAGYLRKFISVTLQLPIADRPEGTRREQTNFVRRFLDNEYPPSGNDRMHEFTEALSVFAPVFSATFRDLQNAMLMGQLFKQSAENWHQETAYLLLLRLRDPESYDQLMLGNKESYQREKTRLGEYNDRDHQMINQCRNMFEFAANPTEYAAELEKRGATRARHSSPRECEEFLNWLRRAQGTLKVEHLLL